MDGIILINKEKNITSRDVVNIISKKLKTKKVGHTGTLDPLATGLMVICVNEGCKLVELLTSHDKDYIAKVKIGVKTDTYDITGHVIAREENVIISKEKLENTLKSFIGEYNQEVPIYSSVKVNGKKLYQYARRGESVTLPKRLVQINDIKLLSFDKKSFSFFVSVSKGCYIRSLINDIGKKLNIPLAMEELNRTRVGEFKLENACLIDDLKIIPISEALNIKKVNVGYDLLKKIKNGVPINNTYNEEMILFMDNNNPVALYKNDNGILKSYRVFKYKD